jgi:crossover junction endodeoxyribonuclease RuvC
MAATAATVEMKPSTTMMRRAAAAAALALAVGHVWRAPAQDRLRVAALAAGAGVGSAGRPARWTGVSR